MAHQNADSTKAANQNAGTEPRQTGDQPQSQRQEPRSYVAADAKDATLAAPAAGEIGEFADEGDELDQDLGAVQQGRDNRNTEMHVHDHEQGPKTRAKNREMTRSGSPDQGTH